MYNIRLTIKAIIRAEQMLSKPFCDIDYANPDDLLALLYCAVLANNQETMSFDTFKQIAGNEKQFRKMVHELEKANTVIRQFVTKDKSSGEEDKPGTTEYVKNLVGLLIMAGLDASFAMNEMSVADLPVFIEAYEKRKREEMEASRYWTYLSIIPHIDQKKIRSPKDLTLFPWEEKENREKARQAAIQSQDFARRFFAGEFNHLNKS